MEINRSLQNERGFTLLEMLVVLAIIMILSSSVLYFSQSKLNDMTVLKAMDEVELVIRMAQMLAIEEQRPVVLNVYTDNTELVVTYYLNQEVIYRMPLPVGMKIFITTSGPKLYFKTNGNLQIFGSMVFHYKKKAYAYNIHIGKGRITRDE